MSTALLKKLQKAIDLSVVANKELAPLTTIKIGGPAEFYFEAKTKEKLTLAIQSAISLGIPFFILGGGSNILIGDKGFSGLVIKNATRDITVRAIKGRMEHGQQTGTVYVEVDSGVIFNSFVRFCIEEGYKGIEMHLGLPGTVGGAVYMNSKWTHPVGYAGDSLYQAEIMDLTGNVLIKPQSYFQFAYDTSILQKTREVLLSATFQFARSTKEELWEKANQSIAYRRASQPQGVFTLGCTFRNIDQSVAMTLPTPGHTTSAGFLIDQCKLKGKRIGNAQISTVHANFIQNLGGATAADVIALIELTKEKVKEKFHVTLEEEIVRVGKF